MTNRDHLINEYYSWLKSETEWKNINGWLEITAPYLDRNNDYLQIYLKKTNGGYLLTDGGETISGLSQEGCRLDSPKRQELLQLTLRGYGVNEHEGKLQIKIDSEDDFPLGKHSLIQAILAVNDMFYTASPHVVSLFFEEVEKWLETSNIRYSERVSFKGLSGYTRAFDFLITKSSKKPERLIKTMNTHSKSRADSIIMDWLDIKQIRKSNSKMYAFINDEKKEEQIFPENIDKTKPKSSLEKPLSAMKSYGIQPILWSQREDIKKELAA